VSRLNVLRGFDIPFSIAHHTGGHLGNFARNDGNDAEGKQMQAHPWPTIDDVMAWSPRFYQQPAQVRQRVVVTGDRRDYSWTYSNPAARSGAIQPLQITEDPRALFDLVIGAQTPAPQMSSEPKRPRCWWELVMSCRIPSALRPRGTRSGPSPGRRLWTTVCKH